MSNETSLAPAPPFDTSPHSKILGILFLGFGVVHAIGIGFLLAMFLFLLLMPFGNPNEDQFNLRFVIVLSTVLFWVGLLPIVAGYGLLSAKRWGRRSIAVSSAMTFLFVGAVAVVLVWYAQQYWLISYLVPCVILTFYSGWYLRRLTPAG